MSYPDPYIRASNRYTSPDQSPDYSPYDREKERDFKVDNGNSRHSSKYRSRSRDRDRDRDRDRSRTPTSRSRSRERRHHRRRRSHDRSHSRDRKPTRDISGDRARHSRIRDRDRRHHRRSSSLESYDGNRRTRSRDKYRDRGGGAKDEWLAHVWGDAVRPAGADHEPTDVDSAGSHENYGGDSTAYKTQTPNKTLILRGLGPYVTEKDINEEMIHAGGNPRDIRLIRKKDTGSSRGFAFVEFFSTEEAKMMVERYDGEFRLHGHKVIMQYSIQRDGYSYDKDSNTAWYCRCGALNFKRRKFCYMCGSDRKTGECTEVDENSSHPTHTVMLKGLDTTTTAEMVLKVIQTVSTLPIRSVRIARDKVTNVSRGICYLEMNHVSDAIYLHNTLLNEKPLFNGRQVYVAYYKITAQIAIVASSKVTNAGNAAIAAAQWSHQNAELLASAASEKHNICDVPKLAEYSATVYAKNEAEKQAYIKHYTEYYTKVINEGGTIPNLNSTGMNPASTGFRTGFRENMAMMGAAPVLTMTPTLTSVAAKPVLKAAPQGTLPSGLGDQIYPVPNVSTYQFDKTSGYYYDPYTTLYYDANSQYYFNSKINKYLYWDGARRTYLLAPDSTVKSAVISASSTEAAEDEKKGGKTDEKDKDKVKVAKRIAKDMEKWAKTLNHKKEVAKQNLVEKQVTPAMKTVGSADIGYAVGVLGKKQENNPVVVSTAFNMRSYEDAMGLQQSPATAAASAESLVAEYGRGSDSEDDSEELKQDDQHVDWVKMACLLCKRAFPNKQTLLKHQQLSDLHKQNLEAWYRSTGISREDAVQKSGQYRDRAKERRVKYNEPDRPPSNRLKENYMKAMEETETTSYEQQARMKIGGDNVGNRMLQKMGWQEGMGLGRSNQGMTDIIEAQTRPVSAGLGVRSLGVTPGPGETYKDCVKKMMRARYEEVDNR